MKIRHHIYAAAVAAMLVSTSYAADIKLGVIGPFTGGSSPMGVSNRGGIRLAVKEINAAGGINGNKIVLIERDDEAKNERGVQISQEFINNHKNTRQTKKIWPIVRSQKRDQESDRHP